LIKFETAGCGIRCVDVLNVPAVFSRKKELRHIAVEVLTEVKAGGTCLANLAGKKD